MTFLPIVERELRVAARRRGTYRTRMMNAGAATLAFFVCFVASLLDPSISFVKCLFWGLSGLCMLYCLAAGRLMTADCLSREKREGTLGLLFLTDLKGYDIVLGKLAATSLDGFYGLLAVLPLLAIPLLAGGMTSGEFWRMALALVNTFLFSAAIGLVASSASRDERKTMGANLGLLLWLAAMPPAVFGLLKLLLPNISMESGWFYSCPVYSFWQCADARFKVLPEHFWCSIFVTFSLTWLLLLLACWKAPRSWQDKPVPARLLRRKGERRQRWWRKGNVAKALAFRKRLLDQNAYYWLAARPYLKAWYVWIFLSLMGCWWASLALSLWHVAEEANVVVEVLLNIMLKLWITTEAGQQLAEDKKSGSFELLLSTPLTVGDMLRGPWLALRRQFLKPLAVAVVVEVLLVFYIRAGQNTVQLRCLWLAGILMLVADAITLGWVAMLASLTSKNHARATIKTAASVLVLPWLLFGAVELAVRLFMFLFARQYWEPNWPFDLGCWFGVGVCVDIFFVLRARRLLHTKFRQLIMESLPPRRRFAWLRDWRAGSPARKDELRARFRRQAFAAAVALVVGTALVLYDLHVARAHLPKPLVVSISQSHHPVRVFGAQQRSQDGFLFILPDGTLWSWGRQGLVSPPWQVGTNRDWLQVSGYNNVLGLRSNGTLWTWPVDSDEPKQFGSDHDWVEACAAIDFFLARKQDGTLWAWGNNNQSQLGHGPGPNCPDAVRVGTNRDWQAVSGGPVFGYGSAQIVALRGNGTLWTWGPVNYMWKVSWNTTNCPVPMQLCRESNWIGFNDNLEIGARNQAGESWCLFPLAGLPGASVPISAIGHLVSSNAGEIALGPRFTTYWEYVKYEMRTNGTLWTSPWPSSPWGWPVTSATPLAPPLRFGQRSDWVSVWGAYQTMMGMTSDGTLWTWGLDYGQESHWIQVFEERVRFIKAITGYVFGITPPLNYSISDQYPPQKEPRPLLRLVLTNSAEKP